MSQTDARARNAFLDLITKFAHQTPNDKNKTKNGTNIFGFEPYSSDGEKYLKITDKVTADKNFRYNI